MRAALSQPVEKFGQNLVSCNQADFSKRLPRANYLCKVLIVWMKCRTPVERVREDSPHFLFGVPCR